MAGSSGSLGTGAVAAIGSTADCANALPLISTNRASASITSLMRGIVIVGHARRTESSSLSISQSNNNLSISQSANLPMVCIGKPTAFIRASALLCVTGPGFMR